MYAMSGCGAKRISNRVIVERVRVVILHKLPIMVAPFLHGPAPCLLLIVLIPISQPRRRKRLADEMYRRTSPPAPPEARRRAGSSTAFVCHGTRSQLSSVFAGAVYQATGSTPLPVSAQRSPISLNTLRASMSSSPTNSLFLSSVPTTSSLAPTSPASPQAQHLHIAHDA